jgi:dephospho-CoA kinase
MKQMSDVRIIGLSGTNGAGKDTVGELLAKNHGYLFVSVTELLRDEARRRGQPVERGVLREISAEWRREHGLGVLVDRAVQMFEEAGHKYQGLVLSSLRNPAEADRVHELGGVMVWVDADPRIRYDRIQANAASRNRGGEDNKTFEQFLDEEDAEMHRQAGGDEATLNTQAVKDRVDKTIMNNSGNLDDLDRELSAMLGL